MTAEPIALSRRQKTTGPNHHLWNNHGTWWLHATIHRPDFTSHRVRLNLKNADITTARQKRDQVLARLSTSV
jgi:hypothetical protein